jgi:hypothetical protein
MNATIALCFGSDTADIFHLSCDFSREDLHDLELAAGLLASSSIMQAS